MGKSNPRIKVKDMLLPSNFEFLRELNDQGRKRCLYDWGNKHIIHKEATQFAALLEAFFHYLCLKEWHGDGDSTNYYWLRGLQPDDVERRLSAWYRGTILSISIPIPEELLICFFMWLNEERPWR